MPLRKVKVDEDLDKTYCKSIANSIADIIRFSLDEDFRKRCFALFGASSTNETEKEINKRLMSIIKSENIPGKSKKERKIVQEKENLEVKREPPESREINSSSSLAIDSTTDIFMPMKNIFKRNWLEISSKKFKESVKRKKLCYYSQPQPNQTSISQSSFDFHSCHINSSSSQPTTSSGLCYVNLSSSSEASDDGTNCLRGEFKQSFKNNAHKYFKRNLKFQNHLSL